MSDNSFLEQIRATEREAENIIEQARVAAVNKIEIARQEVSELLDKSSAEARRIQAEKIAAADREAKQVVDDAVLAASGEADKLYDSVAENMPAAVEKTAERIVKFSVDR